MSINRIKKNRKYPTSSYKICQHLNNYKSHMEAEIRDFKNKIEWVDVLIKSLRSPKALGMAHCPKCLRADLRYRKDGGFFCKRCGYNHEINKGKNPM